MLKQYMATIIWTLILLPASIMAFYEISDSFNYRTVALVKYYQASPSLPIYERTPFANAIRSGVRAHPLHEIHFSIVEKIVGLDAKTYQNFPLGAALLILMYTIIVMSSGSRPSLIMFFILIPFAMFVYTSPLIGTYFPTYGYILFTSIIIVLIKTISIRNYNGESLIITLILIIALNFIYYTIYFALCCILALGLILRMLLRIKTAIIGPDIIILAILIILFSFNEIIYETIEKISIHESLNRGMHLFYLRYLGKIIGNIEMELDPYVFISRTSWYYSILNIIRFNSIALVSTTMPLAIVYKIFKDRKFSSTNQAFLFMITVSLMPVTVLVIYIVYGGYPKFDLFFLSYSILMTTLISDLLFKKFNKIFIMIAVFISIISILTYLLFIMEDKVVLLPFSYKDATSASHFLSHGSREIRILSDLRTIGVFTVLLAENNITLRPVFYDSQVYDALLKGNIFNKNIDLIIINGKLADRPTTSIFWNYYQPLELFIDDIIKKYELIYNDNYLYIIR
ncbi:MAG: hypothetical protein QW096_11200 [Thermofilaceae archaeon]